MSARRTWFNALGEKDFRATTLAIQAEHCQFVAWTLDNWAITAFLEMHLNAIRHFSNIHTLEFHSVHIPVSIWDLRGPFQNVKSMLFSECRFEAFTAISFHSHINVRLTNLSIFGCHDLEPDHVVELSLFVFREPLRALHTDEYPLCSVILGQAVPEHGSPIEELSLKFTSHWIANSSFITISRLLENAPHIQTLSLTHGPPPAYMGVSSLTISPLALPRLRSLHCPVNWAPGLARNRPVEQLRLVDTYGRHMLADEIIAAVSASSAVIKDLEISVDSFCAVPIHELCPGLQDLTLIPNRNSSYENSFARFEVDIFSCR
ncbi:hypothetical protein CERSUDRAFT_96628 [Gelatoporia subvermispora B]|uniref:F-box domain-containing protein n=1 Tax=Ceriporiopsis subvermispora (strain B) TaxID=914234 RepID=M2QEN7_CERS8|nr:hypothetical protein CERSUDRAFT_96628 [Gelatoporia subvermispora B]